MHPFLLVYSATIDKQALRDLVDNHPNILNWSAVFTQSYFLVSDLDAKQLTRILIKAIGHSEFFITAINGDPDSSNGIMAKEDWDFLLDPSAA